MKLLCALAVFTLTACAASTPPVRYHTLLASPASPPAAAVERWQLLPVTVPVQVDRPQWVVRAADESLAVLEQEQWIAPLADEIGAALTDALARRFGPPTLTADAWRIRVDVQRFESVPGRMARVQAAWVVQRPGSAGLNCARTLELPASGGYGALAAAHREAVARLGAEIAGAIAALSAGQQVSCSG